MRTAVIIDFAAERAKRANAVTFCGRTPAWWAYQLAVLGVLGAFFWAELVGLSIASGRAR